MSYIFEIAKTALQRFTKPVKDSAYLKFVRCFPCIACGSTRRVEAAHIGPHAYSERSSDFTALPICFDCHQGGKEALHKIGPERFQLLNGIEFSAMQAMFNRFYFLKTGKHAQGWESEQERRAA
jgi:hypothetical protein